MNGEKMQDKTFADVEQAIAEAKKNLWKHVVIKFKPPVTCSIQNNHILFFMRFQTVDSNDDSEAGEDKILDEVHPE